VGGWVGGWVGFVVFVVVVVVVGRAARGCHCSVKAAPRGTTKSCNFDTLTH